jgi:hypothetical protein
MRNQATRWLRRLIVKIHPSTANRPIHDLQATESSVSSMKRRLGISLVSSGFDFRRTLSAIRFMPGYWLKSQSDARRRFISAP